MSAELTGPIARIFLLLASMAILPFFSVGLIRKLKARMQNRIGAPLLQPFYDFAKLANKDQTISETTTTVFLLSSAINVAAMILIAVLVPWLSFKPSVPGDDLFLLLYLLALLRFMIILSALDAGSSFGAFAASREAYLAMLVEPAMFISLAALGLLVDNSSLSVIFSFNQQCTIYDLPVWLAAALALFLTSMVDLSRMPIDDPTTHLELTMVHEAMILENSGKNLALVEFAHLLKMVVLYGLASQCLLHAATYFGHLNQVKLGLLSVAGILVLAMATAMIEAIAVKLQWRRTPEFIAFALTISLFAVVGALIGGSMHVTIYEICGIMCAVIAVFMLGSRHLRFQLAMYTWQIWLIAGSTAYFAWERNDWHFYVITVALIVQRAVIVPTFLEWIVKRINVSSDPGMIIPAPLTMHLSILLFGLSFFVSQHLPQPGAGSMVTATATASLSHIFSGLLLMFTRRLALSQIIGFLTLENGVILFALSQTAGLPLLIEMAVFVDILGAVMIAGVLIFSIKKSFAHIDVSRLADDNH